MSLSKLLAVPMVVALAGCQFGQPPKKTEREQQLEQRVEELEQKLQPSPSADPAPAAVDEASPAAPGAPPARTAPVPVERTRAVPARLPASRPTADRVERIPPPVADDDTRTPAAEEQVEPRPTRIVLPQNTELTLVLEQAVSSATSRAGDPVTARVERAVSEDGRIVLPGGTVLQGKVAEALPSGRVKGRARVAIDFDRIVVRGVIHELDASPVVAEAPSESGRDAKIVGGAAAAGLILGAITKGGKGAVRGTVLGGAAGGAAVLLTKGREIEIPSGSRWTVKLRDSLRL